MTNQENPSRLDYGLLLMRLTLAFILIHHGGQKMFGLWGGSVYIRSCIRLRQFGVAIVVRSRKDCYHCC